MSKTRETVKGKVTDCSKSSDASRLKRSPLEQDLQKASPPNQKLLNQRLFDAVEKQDKTAVKRLIAAGADVNSQDNFEKAWQTPLMKAVCARDSDMVRLLVENGADVNAESGLRGPFRVDEGNIRALTYAARVGSTEMIKFLIEHGAETNLKFGSWQQGLLSVAAESGNIEGIRLFLKLGADINEKDKNGRTALQHAASTYKIEAMKELISRGAREDGNRIQGLWNFLSYSEEKYVEPIQLLFSVGANLNEILWYAAQCHAPKITRLLLENGVDANFKTPSGETALFLAADSSIKRRNNESVDEFRARRTGTIWLLYSHGAKLDSIDWENIRHFDHTQTYPKTEHILITALGNSGVPSVEELELHLIAGANIHQVHRKGKERLAYLDGYVEPFQSEYRAFFKKHGAKI
ncbi:ankyrin repeat domain-containing protein [Candidatus Micrarchaeota archaeon]|nr:ankyrin repeat domain-containing protein [Candidatus Micrarchaeota archaeon]